MVDAACLDAETVAGIGLVQHAAAPKARGWAFSALGWAREPSVAAVMPSFAEQELSKVLAVGAMTVLLILLFVVMLGWSPSKSAQEAKRLPRVTILALAFTGGLDFFCTDQFQPSMPDMATDFAVPQSKMSLMIQVHQVCCGLATLIAAPVSDRVGRRPVLLLLQMLLMVSTFLCACAPNYEWFAAGRVLQGISAASCSVILAMTRDCYEDEAERMQVCGMLFATMLMGPLVAPPIGGFVAARFGWRCSFFLLAAAAGAVLVLSLLVVPETAPKASQQSYWAAAYRTLANKRRLYLLACIALFKSTFCVLDGSNSFMLEDFYGLSLNRASLMVSLLAVSGALGTVISATLGWKCVEVMRTFAPAVAVAMVVDIVVGVLLKKSIAWYMFSICFQHLTIFIMNLAVNVEFLQDLDDIAGMASCVQSTGAYVIASLLSLPGLAAASVGAGPMLLTLAAVIFLAELVLGLGVLQLPEEALEASPVHVAGEAKK
mmetsp:Transcript_45312/g.107679  ORF Transcript_45312/g.107679 Transcript_45312/m.107679 type:complete len:489 (-) Transcript_45312:81-1547(-)